MGGWDAPWHWVVLAIIVIALFYSRKLPDAARSLGRSLRIFKTELKGMAEDDKARVKAAEEIDSEPKALPAADVVRRETPDRQPAEQPAQDRPRPSPSPHGRP
jgi:sec-independent protein translocase protein TatA